MGRVLQCKESPFSRHRENGFVVILVIGIPITELAELIPLRGFPLRKFYEKRVLESTILNALIFMGRGQKRAFREPVQVTT